MSSRKKKNTTSKTAKDVTSLAENLPLFSIFNIKQIHSKYAAAKQNATKQRATQQNENKNTNETNSKRKVFRRRRYPLSPVNTATADKGKPYTPSPSAKRGVKRILEDDEYINTSLSKYSPVKSDRPRRKIAKNMPDMSELSEPEELHENGEYEDDNESSASTDNIIEAMEDEINTIVQAPKRNGTSSTNTKKQKILPIEDVEENVDTSSDNETPLFPQKLKFTPQKTNSNKLKQSSNSKTKQKKTKTPKEKTILKGSKVSLKPNKKLDFHFFSPTSVENNEKLLASKENVKKEVTVAARKTPKSSMRNGPEASPSKDEDVPFKIKLKKPKKIKKAESKSSNQHKSNTPTKLSDKKLEKTNSNAPVLNIAPVFIRKSKTKLNVEIQAEVSNLDTISIDTNLDTSSIETIDKNALATTKSKKKPKEMIAEEADLPMSRFKYKPPIETTLPSWAEFKQVTVKELLAGRVWQGFNTTVITLPKLEPIIPQKRENVFYECQQIKATHPNYPVYRCFKMMRERNGYTYYNFGRPDSQTSGGSDEFLKKEFTPVMQEPTVEDNMLWTEKYKPTCAAHIIGNYHMISKLKNWLEEWVRFVESEADFVGGLPNSFCPQRCNILTGGSGTGKTSAVYALAEEMNIKILELNAGCKRSKKHLEKQLMEATQSYQVSLRKREKVMCLLLIEDADLVFDQDEGFVRGLHSLIVISKRPVILITSNIDAAHLVKYKDVYPILTFYPFSGSTLAIYLQVMCLVEGLKVDTQGINQLLFYFKGDARRATLQLQFWLQAGGDSIYRRAIKLKGDELQPYFSLKGISREYKDFDNGLFMESQSGAASYLPEDARIHSNIILSALEYKVNQIFPAPISNDLIWWNIPNVLRLEEDEDIINDSSDDFTPDLNDLVNFYDTLSYCNALNKPTVNELKQRSFSDWDDNKSEVDIDVYPDSSIHYVQRERKTVVSYLLEASGRRVLQGKDPGSWDFTKPHVTQRIWKRKQQKSDNVFNKALPLLAQRNLKAFKTDYGPYLRSMARRKMQEVNELPQRHKRTQIYFDPLETRIPPKRLEAACKPYSFLEDRTEADSE